MPKEEKCLMSKMINRLRGLKLLRMMQINGERSIMISSLIARGKRNLKANYQYCKQRTWDKLTFLRNKTQSFIKPDSLCNNVNPITSKIFRSYKMRRYIWEDHSRAKFNQMNDIQIIPKLFIRECHISRKEWRT